MVYAIVWIILAMCCSVYAMSYGGYCWILLWFAIAFGLVGLAYARVGPAMFGKRADGRIRPFHLIILFPYLLLTWTIWNLLRFTNPAQPWNEIAPRLYAGRRVFLHELPPNTELIVDLTAEFMEPVAIRSRVNYYSLPILDAGTARLTAIVELVSSIVDFPGNIYIHCAQGHGRTGMIAAIILLAREIATTPSDAIRRVQQARSGVRLNSDQHATLEEFDRYWRLRNPSGSDNLTPISPSLRMP